MAMTNQAAHGLSLFLFNNTAFASWGDGTGIAARGTPGSLWMGLYSSDGGVTTTSQATNELSYTGYSTTGRQGLTTNSSTGWTVNATTGAVGNATALTWGACTASSGTANNLGIGNASSGAGYLVCMGAVTTPLAISVGITPSCAIGALTFTLS